MSVGSKASQEVAEKLFGGLLSVPWFDCLLISVCGVYVWCWDTVMSNTFTLTAVTKLDAQELCASQDNPWGWKTVWHGNTLFAMDLFKNCFTDFSLAGVLIIAPINSLDKNDCMQGLDSFFLEGYTMYVLSWYWVPIIDGII